MSRFISIKNKSAALLQDMNQKVSIIMPAFNAERYIAESISSVLAQDYQNWELIIVDDGSTDNTPTIVSIFQKTDERIKYFWQKNGKQGKARNKGIEETEGSFVAFLDADDIWNPTKISQQVNLLTGTKSDLVFGYSYLLESGVKTNKKIGRGLGEYRGEAAIEFLLLNDAFIMSTVLVKRDALLQVGCFEEDVKIQYCEDWHIWLKLAFEGFTFYTDSVVVSYYRIHQESATAIEQTAQIKFYYVLLDMYKRYGSQTILTSEIMKRSSLLVYNTKELSENLVNSILQFSNEIDALRLPLIVFKILFKLNVAVFRKVFLKLDRVTLPAGL